MLAQLRRVGATWVPATMDKMAAAARAAYEQLDQHAGALALIDGSYIRVNPEEVMGAHETKTFRSGNSIALRLPKSLAIGPDERMVIEQDGDVLTVRRIHDPADEKRKLMELLADLEVIGRPSDGVQARLDFEAPERPGR